MAKKRKKKKALSPQEKGARTRKRVKLMIAILTILFIDFVLSLINMLVVELKDEISPYWLTAIGMILVATIFFPTFFFENFLNRGTEWVVKKSLDVGRSFLGQKWGVVAIFFTLLFVLYVALYWVWFDVPPFT